MQSKLFTTPALLELTKIYTDAHWGVGDRTALPTSARAPSPLPVFDACRLPHRQGAAHPASRHRRKRIWM